MGMFDRKNEDSIALDDRGMQRSDPASTRTAVLTPPSSAMSPAASSMSRPPLTLERAKNTILKIRCTNQEGQVVNETTQIIPASGKATATLHFSKPEGWPAGQYRFEVFINDVPAVTMDFEVAQR